MVTSAQTPTEHLRGAIDWALRSGVEPTFIIDMVADLFAHPITDSTAQLYLPGCEPEKPPIFTELPEGMIDAPTACAKYNIKDSTLRTWIHKGNIVLMGRLKARAPGGGRLVIREEDLIRYKNTPRPHTGRPKGSKNTR